MFANPSYTLLKNDLILVDGRYYVGAGCPPKGLDQDGRFQPQFYQASAVCCSKDGRSCQATLDRNKQFPYYVAAAKCQEMGLRLCTRQELSRGICCAAEYSWNDKLSWTSTLESGMHINEYSNSLVLVYWSKIQKHTNSNRILPNF